MHQAPKGKFRVIAENIYSEKHIVGDYPKQSRAFSAAKMIGSKLQKCYIYNDKGVCLEIYP
jgi:hypothetical protein